MQKEAVDAAVVARAQSSLEKDIAKDIRLHFNKKYGAQWHCIVGRDFSSSISHEPKTFIFFQLGSLLVLLFKAG